MPSKTFLRWNWCILNTLRLLTVHGIAIASLFFLLSVFALESLECKKGKLAFDGYGIRVDLTNGFKDSCHTLQEL